MTTPLDSTIFAPLFNDDEVSNLLSDVAFVRRLVEVEVALARAEARVGVISTSAAEQIAKVQADKIDIAALTKGTLRSGFPIIALVQELRKQVGADAATYVHWGATTQDIMDTACVLQLRAVIELIGKRIGEIVRHLSALADKHRGTVLAGRTHGQQALPITFGLKVAGWLAPLNRHGERLEEIQRRLLVVQFGGAAGTLAALGDKGLAVMNELAKELGLREPVMPWHAQRDCCRRVRRLVESGHGFARKNGAGYYSPGADGSWRSRRVGRSGPWRQQYDAAEVQSDYQRVDSRRGADECVVTIGFAQRADSRARTRDPWLAGGVADLAADDHAHRRRA